MLFVLTSHALEGLRSPALFAPRKKHVHTSNAFHCVKTYGYTVVHAEELHELPRTAKGNLSVVAGYYPKLFRFVYTHRNFLYSQTLTFFILELIILISPFARR